jgi:hypothetical protein
MAAAASPPNRLARRGHSQRTVQHTGGQNRGRSGSPTGDGPSSAEAMGTCPTNPKVVQAMSTGCPHAGPPCTRCCNQHADRLRSTSPLSVVFVSRYSPTASVAVQLITRRTPTAGIAARNWRLSREPRNPARRRAGTARRAKTYSAARRSAGAAAFTSSSTCSSNLAKLLLNMSTSARACAS